MQARSLQDHLAAAEGAAKLAAHAQRLLRLQKLFETALPPNLRSHARVANLRQGKLIIHAANSTVAAKLRQFGPRFADVFLNDGAQINEIDVRVQAIPTNPPKQKKQPKIYPSENRKWALAQLADSLPPDSPLRDSLRSLLHSLKEQ